MSLVSVLMAVGIGAIVLAGITTMIADVFKSQRTAQSKDAHRELTASIRQLLLDPAICSASFKGHDPAGTGYTITQIVDAAIPANIKYKAGVQYLNNLVTITEFEVRNFVANNPAVSTKIGKSELNIKMNKLGSTIGSPQMTTTIFLETTLNAADSNLNSCYALGLADSLWQISPTNMADIYYPSGNVGIGIASPISTLNVWGTANNTPSEANAILNLRTKNQGFGLIFGSALTATGFSYIQTTVNGVPSNGVPLTTTNLALNPTGGNVGIGTTSPSARLDLGGGNIAMGWEHIITRCDWPSYIGTWCTAACSPGKRATGGGCEMQADPWIHLDGPRDYSYSCQGAAGGSAGQYMLAHVYCANIQ